MNLITCWSCGVILNKDALNFPPVFDGNDDDIEINYAGIAGSAARTCAAWIKVPDTITHSGGIIAWGDDGTDGIRWDFLVQKWLDQGTTGAQPGA